jgi:hypothetical protein
MAWLSKLRPYSINITKRRQKAMWKYLVALVVLLSMGAASALEVCTDCYANIITQDDTQTIENVKLGDAADDNPNEENVAIGNEALSAAIIVTPTPDEGSATFKYAGFARIDQVMDQKISNLGVDTASVVGAKGITWNKAIQSAWIANQGLKEKELDENGDEVWVKEGAYISQNTTQLTENIIDFDSREGAKILNLDNKLAMIVDDLKAVINLTAEADAATTDSQSSTATITNEADVDIDASTTGYPVVD